MKSKSVGKGIGKFEILTKNRVRLSIKDYLKTIEHFLDIHATKILIFVFFITLMLELIGLYIK